MTPTFSHPVGARMCCGGQGRQARLRRRADTGFTPRFGAGVQRPSSKMSAAPNSSIEKLFLFQSSADFWAGFDARRARTRFRWPRSVYNVLVYLFGSRRLFALSSI